MEEQNLGNLNANGRSIYFSYDSAGHLTRISYPDNKSTEFFYDGDILASVQNNDGRQISYKYQDDCGVKRVSEVFEHTLTTEWAENENFLSKWKYYGV